MDKMNFKRQQDFCGITLILVCVFLVLASSQEVTHTLSNGQSPCPGEEIIFTCVTRDSPILAWTSDQYVEQGGTQLEFATFNNENETRASPVVTNTVATLTKNAVENGVRVLESQLRIITLPSFPTFSVTCIHIGSGNQNVTTFRLLQGDPNEPQNFTSQQKVNDDGCMVHLSWGTPNDIAVVDITRYMVHINGTNILNVTSIESITVAYSVNECARHNITIRAVNRCGQLGLSLSDVPDVLLPLELTTEVPTPKPVPVDDNYPWWTILLSVIVPLLICSSFVIAVPLIILCRLYICRLPYKIKKYEKRSTQNPVYFAETDQAVKGQQVS